VAEETTTKTQAPAPEATPTRAAPRRVAPPTPTRTRAADRRTRRRRVCNFCVEKIDFIDYKKPDMLMTYISNTGKIYSRRRSGVCAKHQRRLARAIKRARFLALLPYTAEHIREYGAGQS